MTVSLAKKTKGNDIVSILGGLPFMDFGKSSVLWYLVRQPWFQALSAEEREKAMKRVCPSLNAPSLES